MVLCFSRKIVSLQVFKKLVGHPNYHNGLKEPSHAPKLERPDNTFKELIPLKAAWNE